MSSMVSPLLEHKENENRRLKRLLRERFDLEEEDLL
jgi:hypothetical protein